MEKEEILRKIAAIKQAQIKLSQTLENKDAQILPNEKLDALVDDVEDLPTYAKYADEGVIELITDNATLTINNISDKPYELCLTNEELVSHDITSLDGGFLVPELSASIDYSQYTPQNVTDDNGGTKTIYFMGYASATTPNGDEVQDCLKITIYSRSNENGYFVELDYSDYNTAHPSSPIVFTGGYPYLWLTVYHDVFGGF